MSTSPTRAAVSRGRVRLSLPTLFSLLCAVLAPPAARAAETSALPTVVVTATRAPQPLSSTLSDVRVITSETLRQSGAATLVEVLRAHGGVEITANGGPGQTAGVFLRGTNSNHVLVLLDGVRINSATAGTTALESLPLAQIERVEVLRGPASSLYGADAIGGVIQIFTRQRDRTELRAGLGRWRTREASAGVGRSFGTTRLDVQAGWRETRSFSATNASSGFLFDPDRDGNRNGNLSAALTHDWARDQRLTLRAFGADDDTEFDGSPGAADVNRRDLSSFSLESRNRLTAAWSSLARVARGTDDTRIEGSFPSRFRTHHDQATWQNDIAALGGRVVAGAELRRERVASDTAFTQTRRHVRSLFGGYAGEIGSHGMQLSLRNDDDSDFGSHRSGNIAYGWHITPAWRLSAGAGSAFKAPTFSDLYFPFTDFGGGFTFSGNPDLDPERSRSVEAALRFEQAGWRAGATLFRNRIRDLIASTGLTLENVNRARIRGATLDASYAGDAWRAAAEWTHQSAVDRDSGQHLLRRARDHASASLTWTPGAWHAGAELVLSGQRPDFDFATFGRTRLGGYGLLNLNGGWRLTPELTLAARLDNATDRKYELVRGFNTTRRNLFVWLEYAAR